MKDIEEYIFEPSTKVEQAYKRGFEDGKAEAIDELLCKCELYNYTCNSREFAKAIREQLKEKNENQI